MLLESSGIECNSGMQPATLQLVSDSVPLKGLSGLQAVPGFHISEVYFWSTLRCEKQELRYYVKLLKSGTTA